MSTPNSLSDEDISTMDQAHRQQLKGDHLERALYHSSSSSSGSASPGSGGHGNGEMTIPRVKNLPGYHTPVFKGKDQQRLKVQTDLLAKVSCSLSLSFSLTPLNALSLFQGFIPGELVQNEVNWFYNHLGIDDTYFTSESPAVIADHILALFGAKVLAFTKGDPSKLVIDLEKIDDNGATFIHTSAPGVTAHDGPGATCETR
jgi:glutamate dehydrogenase